MNLDAELAAWAREWQSESPVPPNLRAKVERQSRWMRIALAADILVTIVIGGGALVWAANFPGPGGILLAAATWLFIAAAWVFSLTANRGNWSPSALDTAAFIELSIRRCRARLAGVWFGAVLFLSEIVFCLGWVYRHLPRPIRPLSEWLLFSSLYIDAVWVATLLFSFFLFWFWRRKKAELAYLLGLREEIPNS